MPEQNNIVPVGQDNYVILQNIVEEAVNNHFDNNFLDEEEEIFDENDEEFDDEIDDIVEEHLNNLQDQIEDIDNYGVSLEEENLNKKFKYKIIFSSVDKKQFTKIAYPADFEGTESEILQNVRVGKKGFTRLAYIPNKYDIYESKKRVAKFKKAYKAKPKKSNVFTPISKEIYYVNTNKYYTLVKNDYVGDNPYNLGGVYSIMEAPQSNTSIRSNIATYASLDGTYYMGVTTGKYNSETKDLELIASKVKIPVGSLSHAHFSNECKLEKITVSIYEAGSINTARNNLYEFCRLRIKSYKESGRIFGFASIKKKMVGSIITPDKFTVHRKYASPKLNERADIVEVYSDGKKANVKFLLSDVEFLYIDPTKFTTSIRNAIKVGDICKIVDDRRISFKRGEEVKVVSITVDKVNYKNSIVTICKKNDFLMKQLDKVYIKQLKLIKNATKEQEENKQNLAF